MTGVAAIALCAAFTSCSKGDELYDQGAIDQMDKAKVTQTYNEAFIKVFGQPSANQDWGFGSNAGTRGTGAGNVYKPDMTNYPNFNDAHVYDYPAPITPGERAYVENWFHNNTGFTAGLNISDFYVQHVSATVAVRDGLFHGYEQNRVNNGYDSNYYTEAITQEAYLDKLEIGSAQNLQSTQHIFDFNRQNVGDWDNVYVKGGSALQFGVHSSWGTDVDSPNKDGYYWYFKCASITVPGENFSDNQARTAYYVGICYYGKSVETRDAQGNPEKWRELGNQNVADQRCEDWILKIIPGDPNPPTRNYTICVIGEDLTVGGADEEDLGADFDFNDVVFDVSLEATETWVRLKAAGGTLPLTIDGIEVHGKFGVDTNVMVNTGAGPNKDYVEFKLNNVYTDAKDIPVFVTKGGRSVELTAVQGEPASKIGVKTDYVWCGERVGVVSQYPLFTQWVTSMHPGTIKWY